MTHRISHRRHFAGALAIAALVASGPTFAQQPDREAKIRAGIEEAVKAIDKSPRLKHLKPETKKDLVEFAIGNTLFVLAHEMGHALIAEMGLPVLGREEDAADAHAVVMALQMKSAYSDNVLIDAAKGWFLSSKRDKKDGEPLAFYDEHGLDLQRAYNVVCLMVGSDPDKFQKLADETKLPEERQRSCVGDYSNATWSWDFVLKPHRRAADGPKVDIKITYQDDEKYGIHNKVLQHMGVLEAFAAYAQNRFVWRAPINMEARVCGDPNARWDFGTKTLILCYEIVDEFVELYVDYSKELPREFRSAR